MNLSTTAATARDAARLPPLRDEGRWRGALGLAAVTLLGFGLAYALAATGLAGALFPTQAGGSLLRMGDRVVGSRWVAQPFVDARYFQPRPSAAGYDPMAAAGSNLARSARIAATRREVAARDGVAGAGVAADLLTQSGSGLDPQISVAAARQQVARVARARGWTPARTAALLAAQIEPPQFGVLGQPRVNVLMLNLALDRAR